MAADTHSTNPATGGEAPQLEKIHVGDFTLSTNAGDFKAITDQIGDILEAQLVLHGSTSLGYGYITFRSPREPAAEGQIAGSLRIAQPKTARGAARGRGAKRAAARARRSADDPASVEDATAEESTQNGVKAVTEGVNNLTTGDDAAAGRGKTPRSRGAKRGRGAARQPRQRRERGEPSKTLVFIRNLPYSLDQEGVGALFKEANLSYSNLTIPVWKFGPHKGKGRGYAFASVESEAAQKSVIEALNGKELSAPLPAKAIAAAAEAAATEGGEAPANQERKLKLVVRQGYENDVTNAEKDHEDEAATHAATETSAPTNGGPDDSGHAEQAATA